MNSVYVGGTSRLFRLPALLALLLLLKTSPLSASDGSAVLKKPASRLDLTKASVFAPNGLSAREKKAVTVLVEEVEKRSGVRWETRSDSAPVGGTMIAVGTEKTLRGRSAELDRALSIDPAPKGAEGFRIAVSGESRWVVVVGNDERGVLFGVGRLLRELRMHRGSVEVADGFRVSTAPAVALRGHQLGYRPKTNSYDGWDLDQWDHYIRDLAIFGTNAIELIPPRSDDDADSPHFPRPPMEMMVGMSRIADSYGLDVWVWYPAMDKDYGDPATVEFALKEWADVFQKLPRIDAVLVPGGDPGHTPPKLLMPLLEKQAASLRKFHPKAGLWISPQGFTEEWFGDFLGLLKDEPRWLTGIVFGPQVRLRLPDLRRVIPARYPIRHYPDITHSLSCQYPVPDWDVAYSLTHEREGINPRPLDQAAIFRATNPYTIGFLTYSEGCNDDVNKFVWSGLGWDPTESVAEILRQYGRYFLSDTLADPFAQGLLALEQNWVGPLLTNSAVETTLQQFQRMEQSAKPADLLNWRFQQALYRAYYDAYIRDRVIRETSLESQARRVLRDARRRGTLAALKDAEEILDSASNKPTSPDRRARIGELAAALFQSIRMQLDVEHYKAIEVGRGTTLATVDWPLNDREWLMDRFVEVRKLDTEAKRIAAIDRFLDRTNPGPGGFYDDLGDPSRQPHLLRGPQTYAQDPDFRLTSSISFDTQPGWPMAWRQVAQTLYATPLQLRYEGLDREAHYRVRIVYGGDNFRPKIRLESEGIEIHPLIAKPSPLRPLEFDVPASATNDGVLTLSWTQEPGRGGNGRGCQVAEVWLIQQSAK